MYRMRCTDTPAASTIAGFSPTARKRKPKRLRQSNHHTPGTSASAKYTSTLCDKNPCTSTGPTKGISRVASTKPGHQVPKRSASGMGGVCPPCLNQAAPRTPVKPTAMMLMATPDTT